MEKFETIPEIPDAIVSNDENADSAVVPSPATMEPTSSDMSPDISRLIAEAEERGYLRGRNERIETEIMTPADPYFGPATSNSCPDDDDEDCCPGFLTHLRPGFWD